MNPSQAIIRRVRCRKEDSAFVYCVLEAHEGVASYSTVDYQPGQAHRDIELSIPVSRAEEAELALRSLGSLIYEAPSSSS